ncbi:hypothetical protein OG394_07940 [Kribbella sp. NBC_01245]|uniref:hypothetical protein n=1 Tax=Kribbella sp. NBC_01245 TaxID=2903578 RepID=UPI002E299D70|nr:hypothetical protein [Kribbella sp. NBC_01245]
MSPRKYGRGRASERQAFVANRAGSFDPAALAEALTARVADVFEAGLLAPGNNVRRWVPIGPSVVRSKRGLFGASWPRATGRVRDLAVSTDGRRAYAATAKGGLWYTEDGAATWAPIGGWAERAGVRGGVNNAQACGCVLVSFGAGAADDFVMIGTGELQGFGRPPARPALGGRGVLAARGPAASASADPWEPEAGIALLEDLGVFELARDPASTAGTTSGAGLDRVMAATSRGLFLGTRGPAAAPHNGSFTWVARPALGPFMGLPAGQQPIVTDVMWLTGGRLLVSVARGLETPTALAPPGSGVAFSDDAGLTFHWVTNLDPTAVGAVPIVGRMSFANPAADRVYVLGDRQTGAPTATDAAVWRIPAAAAATPTADLLTGVPMVWLRNSLGKNQRDYDQTIAVDIVAGVDRIYLGGNVASPSASVWCMDVAGSALVPAPGVSRVGAPPGGDGASTAGLIGDDIHPDVHMIRFAGAAPNRQVWVATDGGVFVSTRAGRAQTFAVRATGMAALEANFIAPHPSSSHFAAFGSQDNGRHSRIGDVVWEDMMGGDGGGVAFHPNQSQLIVSQFFRANWGADPSSGFASPLDQNSGTVTISTDRESNLSAFYSGSATVRSTATVGRLAIGTNRVWLTDNLGTSAVNTWRVLPYPGGVAPNPRSGGGDLPANRGVGVPGGAPLAPVAGGNGPLGDVITAKWASPTVILVLFANGLVRWTQDAVTGQWSSRVLVAPAGVVLAPAVADAPDPAVTMLSDVAPIPGSNDFYLVTTGATAGETCLLFHDSGSRFFPTQLRSQLPPLDPAYSSVVDPEVTSNVYVGTVTGVWRGVRGAGPPAAGSPWPHTWTWDVNGLPQAAVQDLAIWVDPTGDASSPRLLRAAIQARGIWELDLKAATEPQRTYLRVHLRDDRRRLPTPMANPRLRPGSADVVPYASPDVVIRPKASPATAPTWRLGPADTIHAGNVPAYQLWTFQTAFRWIYPSVLADGRWTDAFGALVEFHRSTLPALAPVEPKINKALWDSVVGGTHLSPTGQVTANAADPLAVYRAGWQTPLAMDAVATEVDLLENVVVPRTLLDVQQVFKEPSTVDVLIHHRDTSPTAAFALLLWRSSASPSTLLNTDVTNLPAYVASVLAAGPVPSVPTGWDRPPGPARIPLSVPVDARMPRAVPIDVDLSTIPTGHFVLFLAIAGSTADLCTAPPVGLPATPKPPDLTKSWPHAALRLIRVTPRP